MKPQRVFRIGPVHASVFLNRVSAGENEKRDSYSVNLQRRYQERESGDWKSVSTFRLSELPQAQLALRLATDYVSELEASERSG